MKCTVILIPTIVVSVLPLGCVDNELEMKRLQAILPKIPVVSIVFPTEDKKNLDGSATVIGPRELLLSPHELPPRDNGPVLVDSCLWVFSVTGRVNDPTEASGWATLRLTKLGEIPREELLKVPLFEGRNGFELDRLISAENELQCSLPEIPESIEFDFDMKIPPGTNTAIAYTQTRFDGTGFSAYKPDLKHDKIVSVGRVCKPLIYRESKLKEFLLLKMKHDPPHGASGSPAYILGEDGKTAVIVGIIGGSVFYKYPYKHVIDLIRRPHELELPASR